MGKQFVCPNAHCDCFKGPEKFWAHKTLFKVMFGHLICGACGWDQ
jgi:hypothetical protein